MREAASNLGFNYHRRQQFSRFSNVCRLLKQAGCKKLFLGGSFVSNKDCPNDYDVCWCSEGVDRLKVPPLLLSTDSEAQKREYGGEFYLTHDITPEGISFLELFQQNKYGGAEGRGILEITLNNPNNAPFC